ncbi:MAG: citrate synthase [Candidatus Methylacidiphilales bacterium]
MAEHVTLQIGNQSFQYPLLVGTENEKAIDTRKLRAETGLIAFDEGYGNTGSCESAITYIDGEKGILRHRGYPIEELAEHSSFLETAYLIIYGELPSEGRYERFRSLIMGNASIHEGLLNHYQGFPPDAHPMAVLSSMLNALGCYYPEMASNNRQRDLEHFDNAATILISKVRTLAAATFRMKKGRPFIHPRRDMKYCSNFLHMMFSEPYNDYIAGEEIDRALNLVLLLHADHEQNCSTSTVRMVASGGANLFASVSAGVCALWGPAHGGANMKVIQMLESIKAEGDDGSRFLEAARSGDSTKRLMGFGHRVYKNFDPRAKILKEVCQSLLKQTGTSDPLLDIALRLEDAATSDDYFLQRNLYPNVDFYSGIIMRTIGIPLDMFTVMFAIGRLPGWIAHWKELAENPKGKIHRPRQIYSGHTRRSFVPITER